MSKKLVYRQGEIGLVRVEQIPKNLAEHPSANIVLVHGESGNAHVLVGNDVAWLVGAIEDINGIKKNGAVVASGDVYVHIPEGGTITHSDPESPHRQLEIDSGTYRVVIDREMGWWEKEINYVVD